MKLKRYQVQIFLLAAYAAFMTIYFGIDLLRSGHSFRFWITLGVEIVVLTLAFFALRRREKLREERRKNQN